MSSKVGALLTTFAGFCFCLPPFGDPSMIIGSPSTRISSITIGSSFDIPFPVGLAWNSGAFPNSSLSFISSLIFAVSLNADWERVLEEDAHKALTARSVPISPERTFFCFSTSSLKKFVYQLKSKFGTPSGMGVDVAGSAALSFPFPVYGGTTSSKPCIYCIFEVVCVGRAPDIK
jgi:hypothetical protein